MRTTDEDIRQAYRDALDVQMACNLSGVVHSLSRLMPTIRLDAERRGNGSTEAINRHPIVQAFLSKLISLTGGEFEPDADVWTTCEQRAQQELGAAEF